MMMMTTMAICAVLGALIGALVGILVMKSRNKS